VNGGFSCSSDTGDGIEGVAGDGPAGATLSVDRGGGGIGERAVGDGAMIGARLNGDGVAWGVAEREIGERDLTGGEVEDRTGSEV